MESYPGYQGDNIYGAFFPTLEAAQAALDARINAAREEGRIMGLREAVECCAERAQHWGKAWRASSDFRHTAGLSDGAHTLKNAILAKIKEAENG